MTRARAIIVGLFLVACVAGDAALAIRSGASGASRVEMVLVGLTLGQLALAAIWFAAGDHSFGARLGQITLAAGALSAPLMIASMLSWLQSLVLLVVLATMIAAPLVLLRVAGKRLAPVHRFHDVRRETIDGDRRKGTFSMKGMLLTVTALAVMLGGLRWLAVTTPWPTLASDGIVIIVTAWAGCWIVLGNKVTAPRIILAGLTVAFLVFPLLEGDSYRDPIHFVALVEVLMVVAGAVGFRVAGYRFATS